MDSNSTHPAPLHINEVWRAWIPLAASWLFMAMEFPLLITSTSWFPNHEVNLAAFGGVAFGLLLIIEAPVIMLLSTSTALSTNLKRYNDLKFYTIIVGVILSAIHFLIAFTPLFDLVIKDLMGVPNVLHETVRKTLQVTLPWSYAIGLRRLHQGVLIRGGRSKDIGIGTFIRLIADASVLFLAISYPIFEGAVVAGLCLSIGPIVELIFIDYRLGKLLKEGFPESTKKTKENLSGKEFLAFFTPLAITSVMGFLSQPLGAAAVSRMPGALESLAVWPAVTSAIFVCRSLSMPITELTISSFDRPEAKEVLFKFAKMMGLGTSLLLLFFTASPFGEYFLSSVMGFPDNFTRVALQALMLALLTPTVAALMNYFMGMHLFLGNSQTVSFGVIIFLITIMSVFVFGVWLNSIQGIYIASLAFTFSFGMETIWLKLRQNKSHNFLA